MLPETQKPRRPARILYGVQGEGRGHATRSLEVIQALRELGHEVKVLSGGDALPVLRNGGIDVTPIPMLRYHYRADGSLSPGLTVSSNAACALGLLFRAGAAYRYVRDEAAAFKPDLCLSDFEPYVSRIARALNLPLVAIDHQHFLTETLLPRPHRLSKLIALGLYQIGTTLLGGRPDRIIASSFWHFPRRPGSRALLVGPFLGSTLSIHRGSPGRGLVVYLKRAGYLSSLLPALSAHPEMPTDIFSDWSPRGNHDTLSLPGHVRLRPIDRHAFLDALGRAGCLLTTAGNQVLGEAIYLGKPVLAFPEPDIFEQELNALALEKSGFGISCHLADLDAERLGAFFEALPAYRRRLSQHHASQASYDGRRPALRLIQRMLRQACSPA